MVIMNNSFAEIAEVIKQANNILIFTHHNMDGDAMGASNALGLAIQKLGKNVNVLYDEEPAANLAFLAEEFCTTDDTVMPEPDLTICVDSNDSSRCPRTGDR